MFDGDFNSAYRMAGLTILRDVNVLKEDGTRPVTRVNVGLLSGAAGVSILIYSGLIVAGFWGWWTVAKRRQGYNAFCDLKDAKACLWGELERMYGSRSEFRVSRRNGNLVFGEMRI